VPYVERMAHDATPQAPIVPAAALGESDAAHYTGFSRPYLRRARRDGGGPRFVQVGRSIRYLVADLDAWLTAHRRDQAVA